MTTAHRPTWKAAVGQANEGGWGAGGARSSAVSALDAPAHTKLKFRQNDNKLDRDALLKQSLLQLQEAETQSYRNKKNLFQRPIDPEIEKAAELKLLKQTADIDEVKLKERYDDSDVEDDDDDDDNHTGSGDAANDTDLDDDSDDDSDDDDDDDDDEAALQAELAKIRAEREQAKRKAQEQEDAIEDEKQAAAALLGNPLLQQEQQSLEEPSRRRRWNDDVVFRHQAKGEPAAKKRFINDTVRNDFHKRFLNKFIR